MGLDLEFEDISLYNPQFSLNWDSYSLYSLSDWINGRAFKKKDYSDEGYPVIKIAELNNGLSKNTQFARKDKFDKKFHIKKMTFFLLGQETQEHL